MKGLAADDCANPELFDIERRVVLRVLKSTVGAQLSFEGSRRHPNGLVGKMAISRRSIETSSPTSNAGGKCVDGVARRPVPGIGITPARTFERLLILRPRTFSRR